jgi:hypothetical protein
MMKNVDRRSCALAKECVTMNLQIVENAGYFARKRRSLAWEFALAN